MTKSTHRVDVVRVDTIEPHPNADALGIVRCCGYQVCVRLADWRVGTLAAYVQPDSLVDTRRPEFTFLAGKVPAVNPWHRVRVMRLRGQLSQGLLVPAPAGAAPGDDVADALGVQRYNLPETDGGDDAPAPSGWAPVFDLESARRYAAACFEPGEPVWVTEKVHGENGRWTFRDGAMHCGSRTRWKAPKSAWAEVLQHHPEVVAWCEQHPGAIVYGELYGKVGGYPYGVPQGQRRIAVFDIWQDGGFLGAIEGREVAPALPWVPVLARVPFTGLADLLPLAEGTTTLGGATHLREGCVVRPTVERSHPQAGRVALKLVGDGFLERER